MAWIRTAASLISFDFSIYKFFDYVPGNVVNAELQLINPRMYALMMIGIGLVTLMLASIQQARYLEKLRKRVSIDQSFNGTLAALLVSVMGIVTLLAVILRQ